jgi:archaemetzincin
MKKCLMSFLVLLISVSMTSFNTVTSNAEENSISNPPVIIIKPLGKIEASTIKNVQSTLLKFFPVVRISANEKMPAEAYYAPRKRYRADRIIRLLHNRSKNGEIYIGVTHSDISSTKGPNPDYGLMGLAVNPGKGAVVSDFRLKDKSKLSILALHEVGHTFGLPHCPNKGCYMQDAKGKDHTKQLTEYCDNCSHFLNKNLR